jgi:hypothetical protein
MTVPSIVPRARTRLIAVVRVRPSVAVSLLTLLVGAVYVWVVSPGLPYDEPSHWSTVLFYADHWSLPVLGHPGVTYEAQMGPVAYVVDAIVVRSARTVGLSVDTAFRLVRLLGVVELAGAVLLVAALTKRLIRSSWAGIAAVAVFAVNPMLLAMSASVQNDTLALLLGLLALQLTYVLLGDQPAIGWAAVVGVVAGLAVLTKLTAWAVVVAIPAWLLWRHRRSALRASTAFLASVLAVTGWWFVRNVRLYGDPTAAAGVHKLGLSFVPYHIHGLGGVGRIVEEVVTYLWIPTEYVRNTVHAPAVLKAALLAVTVAVVLVGIRDRRRLPGAASLVFGCGLIAFTSWLVLYLAVQAVPPRLAYLALPMWTALVAVAVARVRPRVGIVGVVAALVVLNAWTVYEISRVKASSFGLTANAPPVQFPPKAMLAASASLGWTAQGALATSRLAQDLSSGRP